MPKPPREGFTLKHTKEVIDKARVNKSLNRALDVEVPESIYVELEDLLNK